MLSDVANYRLQCYEKENNLKKCIIWKNELSVTLFHLGKALKLNLSLTDWKHRFRPVAIVQKL